MSNLKLTIELIPRTAWFKNLREHVGRSTWDVIRNKCYREAGHRCEICNGKGRKWPVECHERWRFEDNKIILEGFIALCPPCHEVKHIGLAQVRGRFDIAKRHFMRVNGISEDVADDYIFEAFEQFHARSSEDWELDLDAIQEYVTPKPK